MSDPNLTGAVTVELDRPRPLTYANYSTFRLSRQAENLAAGKGEAWNYHRTLIYAWAMLDKSGIKRFPEPEDLGEFIQPDNIGDYLPDILQALAAGMGDAQKKTRTSKTGPSAGSASD